MVKFSDPGFLSDVLETLSERGRALLRGRRNGKPAAPGLIELGEALLSRRGEASGVALAGALLRLYETAAPAQRLAFLLSLATSFGADAARVEAAMEAARQDFSPRAIQLLHAATEPRRQELLRRLNLAEGGTAALVRMRAEVLRQLPAHPGLREVDADFRHLFASWFNRGFLTARRIDWTTPAHILDKIVRYEAVHAIGTWEDLRNRLQPADRRCYGFFHPQLVDEPLIFVEVALTRETPGAIAPLLDIARRPIPAESADTAVFYSISNTQPGLAGVSFGNFLIKQVVETLRQELPELRTFVTLSPIPGFAAWLAEEIAADMSPVLTPQAKAALASPAAEPALLVSAAAYYLLEAKRGGGQPRDPVARFHLGNGARVERLNAGADLSPNGLRQSHGMMVNYVYAPGEIEANHEAFVERGSVAASAAVRAAVRALPDFVQSPARASEPSG